MSTSTSADFVARSPFPAWWPVSPSASPRCHISVTGSWGASHIIDLQLLAVTGDLVFVLFDPSMFNGRQHGVGIKLMTLL